MAAKGKRKQLSRLFLAFKALRDQPPLELRIASALSKYQKVRSRKINISVHEESYKKRRRKREAACVIMEGIKVSQWRSLDRLKALDSLTDLPSQLAEANRLCTRSARADMIAKWLLQRLKSSQETRVNAQAWQSLCSTFRLLSPGYLATILISNSFSSTLISALEETQLTGTILEELSSIIRLLFEMSETSNGASVQAVLSLPATKAAAFLGFWLCSIRQRVATVRSSADFRDCCFLLSPAIKMWNLRKPSAEDNELFAKHCLVAAAFLLSPLSTKDHGNVLKRKRHNEPQISEYECTKTLETLLTKHIFLHGRTAFFEAQDPTMGKTRRKAGSQHPMFIIEAYLEPLKSAIGKQDGTNEPYLAALPKLLDISLRCVSTPTPRQRVKEKPWIDAVFHTLLACNKSSTGDIISRNVLIEMLEVVGRRATLSRESLEEIARKHSLLANSSNERNETDTHLLEHWELIAQIITLDADVFVDGTLAERLFTSITQTSIALGGTGGIMDPTATSLQSLWLDRVILPVMKAFGRNRNLLGFVDIWSQQLEKSPNHELALWTELDENFGSLLEDSFNEKQIVELFDRFSRGILGPEPEDMNHALAVSIDFGPAIVILNGILRGLQTESIVKSFGSRCKRLLVRLIALFEQQEDTLSALGAAPINSKRIWVLMINSFELWFPAWIASTSDLDASAEQCKWLISCKALKTALNAARATRSNDDSSIYSLREASNAECFVATVCHSILGCKEGLKPHTRDELYETIENLFQHLDPSSSQSMLLFPSLLLSVQDSRIRTEFLGKCIAAEATSTDSSCLANSASGTLQTLVTMAAEHVQVEVIEDLVRVAVDLLGGGGESRYEKEHERIWHHKESVAIDLLLRIPVTCLTRPQREGMLDAITTIKDFHNSPNQEIERRRLVIMLNLMEIPNATSKLSTDHHMIWRISTGVSAIDYISNFKGTPVQVEEVKTTAMIQELASLVVKHLLATQDQDRSRSMLLDLSRDVKSILQFVFSQDKIQDHTMALAVSSSIMQELEIGSRESLKRELPHRHPDHTLKWVWIALSEATTRMTTMISESAVNSVDPAIATWLNVVLDALSVGVDIVAATGDANVAESICAKVEGILKYVANKASADAMVAARLAAIKLQLVRCFEIACKHAPSTVDSGRIEVVSCLLNMRALPEHNGKLMLAFEDHVKKLDGASRASLIGQLVPQEGVMQRSALLLLQICLSKLEKDDLASTSSSIQHLMFSSLLRTITENDDLLSRQKATSCIITALKTKPFLSNQHIVETILHTLPRFLNGGTTDSLAYHDVCQILSSLLLNHRARLQGRFHLVNQIYQSLITWLFQTAKAPLSNNVSSKRASSKHARALARVITLFCEPLLLRRQANATNLTDESRKEQAHVGQYVQSVLHHYCSQLLNGSLGEGMKDALTPGLWSMIEAIEINDADGMKSLAAAMNNSERAILRGIYDEWKTFGKWKGG